MTTTGFNLSDETTQKALAYFSSSLAQNKDKEEIAWNLVDNFISRLPLEDCVVYFLDNKRNVLVQAAAHGPKNPVGKHIVDPLEIPVGIGITGYVAASGESLIIPNTLQHPLYIKDDQVRLSEISIPIKIDGKVIGVIDCEHSEEDFFKSIHLDFLEHVAELIARRIEAIGNY